jgi:hypothetical protein
MERVHAGAAAAEVRSRRRTDPASKRDPIREAIATRAFELFLERGGQHGHDIDDWLRAEQDVLASRSDSDAKDGKAVVKTPHHRTSAGAEAMRH